MKNNKKHKDENRMCERGENNTEGRDTKRNSEKKFKRWQKVEMGEDKAVKNGEENRGKNRRTRGRGEEN
jgi:hypothetical protein